MSPRYQRGSLRREKRGGKSDLWAWRYRLTGTMKQETYPVILYTTKTAMGQHLEPAVRVLNNQSVTLATFAPTLADAIKKYRELKLRELAASTRYTQSGQLQIHIEPRR
ncbi:MAG: hypothetical protein ABSE55_10500 [Terracidiphilus sp.]